MIGNDADTAAKNAKSADASQELDPRTVALVGYMKGPYPDQHFDLCRGSQYTDCFTVNWQDIRWMDCCPKANSAGEAELQELGLRTIWVQRDSDLISSYLKGELLDECMPTVDVPGGWPGPIYARGYNTASTNAYCICREKTQE
jgi:hypothetical protein